MTHPLVTQLRFTRSELLRCLEGVSDEEARHRFEPMNCILRNIYHYWFHLGEAHAIRQLLGHTDLPQFVGDMSEALYRPER